MKKNDVVVLKYPHWRNGEIGLVEGGGIGYIIISVRSYQGTVWHVSHVDNVEKIGVL